MRNPPVLWVLTLCSCLLAGHRSFTSPTSLLWKAIPCQWLYRHYNKSGRTCQWLSQKTTFVKLSVSVLEIWCSSSWDNESRKCINNCWNTLGLHISSMEKVTNGNQFRWLDFCIGYSEGEIPSQSLGCRKIRMWLFNLMRSITVLEQSLANFLIKV